MHPSGSDGAGRRTARLATRAAFGLLIAAGTATATRIPESADQRATWVPAPLLAGPELAFAFPQWQDGSDSLVRLAGSGSQVAGGFDSASLRVGKSVRVLALFQDGDAAQGREGQVVLAWTIGPVRLGAAGRRARSRSSTLRTSDSFETRSGQSSHRTEWSAGAGWFGSRGSFDVAITHQRLEQDFLWAETIPRMTDRGFEVRRRLDQDGQLGGRALASLRVGERSTLRLSGSWEERDAEFRLNQLVYPGPQEISSGEQVPGSAWEAALGYERQVRRSLRWTTWGRFARENAEDPSVTSTSAQHREADTIEVGAAFELQLPYEVGFRAGGRWRWIDRVVSRRGFLVDDFAGIALSRSESFTGGGNFAWGLFRDLGPARVGLALLAAPELLSSRTFLRVDLAIVP